MPFSTPRRDYLGTPLLEDGAGEDPLSLFLAWFGVAEQVEADATAMALATVSADGQPSARLVLLKEVDVRGFTFFTNYESRKAGELAVNNRASLLFYWRSLDRQVRVEGRVEPIPAHESDAYFQTRPLESQWSAYASPQSRPIDSRDELETRVEDVRRDFGDQVPRPASWGGYRLHPHAFEFWQGRPNRLHDRLALHARRWLLASRAARPVVELAVFSLQSSVYSPEQDERLKTEAEDHVVPSLPLRPLPLGREPSRRGPRVRARVSPIAAPDHRRRHPRRRRRLRADDRADAAGHHRPVAVQPDAARRQDCRATARGARYRAGECARTGGGGGAGGLRGVAAGPALRARRGGGHPRLSAGARAHLRRCPVGHAGRRRRPTWRGHSGQRRPLAPHRRSRAGTERRGDGGPRATLRGGARGRAGGTGADAPAAPARPGSRGRRSRSPSSSRLSRPRVRCWPPPRCRTSRCEMSGRPRALSSRPRRRPAAATWPASTRTCSPRPRSRSARATARSSSSRRRARAASAWRLRVACCERPRAAWRSTRWRSWCARRPITSGCSNMPSNVPVCRPTSNAARGARTPGGGRSSPCWRVPTKACPPTGSPSTCRSGRSRRRTPSCRRRCRRATRSSPASRMATRRPNLPNLRRRSSWPRRPPAIAGTLRTPGAGNGCWSRPR